jgi:hypothetical protein
MGNYTMGDIRNMVTKLINEYQTTTSLIDVSVLNRIDESINSHYMELAQYDKITSSIAISQFPIENMLGEVFSYDTHTTTSIAYNSASAYAYYYEVDGPHSVDIKQGSSTTTMVTLSTLTVTSVSVFTEYKNFVTASVSSDYIQLSFYGDQEYRIRNVAFYPYTFNNSTAAIPAFKPYAEYSLSSDYDDVDQVRYRNGAKYDKFTDYRIEDDKLLIPRGYSAEFFFDYYVIPPTLTTATNTFLIKDRTALIIPYGVAGDILIGNGINVSQGQAFIAEYEKKRNAIDVSKEYGKQTISNTRNW